MFVVIVAGSRSFSDRSLMYKKLDYYLQNQEQVLIVHGGAKGADNIKEVIEFLDNYVTIKRK